MPIHKLPFYVHSVTLIKHILLCLIVWHISAFKTALPRVTVETVYFPFTFLCYLF